MGQNCETGRGSRVASAEEKRGGKKPPGRSAYLDVLANGVAGVQLVGHVAVVLSGHALADGTLHETRERRQHVDGRGDLTEAREGRHGRVRRTAAARMKGARSHARGDAPVVKLSVNVDLALGNVAGKVGNGGGDVI